jgi:phage baseplate assembly protein W
VNRPEFGCGVKQLVFAPNSEVLAAATQQLIHGALLRWLEPVLTVEAVTVRSDEAVLEITVVWSRRETGERHSDTFSAPVSL